MVPSLWRGGVSHILARQSADMHGPSTELTGTITRSEKVSCSAGDLCLGGTIKVHYLTTCRRAQRAFEEAANLLFHGVHGTLSTSVQWLKADFYSRI